MDLNTATEQAYKNGYEQGQKDAAKKIIDELMNVEIKDESWTKNKIFVDYLNKVVDKIEEFARHFGVKIDDGEQRGSNERI